MEVEVGAWGVGNQLSYKQTLDENALGHATGVSSHSSHPSIAKYIFWIQYNRSPYP